MNLTNKLKRGDIQIKKKYQGGGGKVSPMSKNYKKYLQGENKRDNTGDKSKNESNDNISKKVSITRPKIEKEKQKQGGKVKDKEKESEKESNIKIIKKKSKTNKHKFTRKKPSKIKDINEIERQIELSKKKNIRVNLVEDIEKNKPQSNEKINIHNKRSSKRQNKRGSKKRESKKRGSKKRGSKKISFKKSKISQKDIHMVETKIKEIRKKKSDDIKKELEKDGIKVSGKSKRLLKDIYLYSKVCNINIQHEK